MNLIRLLVMVALLASNATAKPFSPLPVGELSEMADVIAIIDPTRAFVSSSGKNKAIQVEGKVIKTLKGDKVDLPILIRNVYGIDNVESGFNVPIPKGMLLLIIGKQMTGGGFEFVSEEFEKQFIFFSSNEEYFMVNSYPELLNAFLVKQPLFSGLSLPSFFEKLSPESRAAINLKNLELVPTEIAKEIRGALAQAIPKRKDALKYPVLPSQVASERASALVSSFFKLLNARKWKELEGLAIEGSEFSEGIKRLEAAVKTGEIHLFEYSNPRIENLVIGSENLQVTVAVQRENKDEIVSFKIGRRAEFGEIGITEVIISR